MKIHLVLILVLFLGSCDRERVTTPPDSSNAVDVRLVNERDADNYGVKRYDNYQEYLNDN